MSAASPAPVYSPAAPGAAAIAELDLASTPLAPLADFVRAACLRLRALLERDLARLERLAAADPEAPLSLELGRHARTLQSLAATEQKIAAPREPAAVASFNPPAHATQASPAPRVQAVPSGGPRDESTPAPAAAARPDLPAAAHATSQEAASPSAADRQAVANYFAAAPDDVLHALLAAPPFEALRRAFDPTTRHLARRWLDLAAPPSAEEISPLLIGSLRPLAQFPPPLLIPPLARELSRRLDRLAGRRRA